LHNVYVNSVTETAVRFSFFVRYTMQKFKIVRIWC